jgi:hypothetical protein
MNPGPRQRIEHHPKVPEPVAPSAPLRRRASSRDRKFAGIGAPPQETTPNADNIERDSLFRLG